MSSGAQCMYVCNKDVLKNVKKQQLNEQYHYEEDLVEQKAPKEAPPQKKQFKGRDGSLQCTYKNRTRKK